MSVRTEPLAVTLPGLRVLRWSTDQLYAGVKETYAIGRVDSGRSEWRSDGRSWTSAPGSFEIQGPGNVHCDVSRDGPCTMQVVSLPASAVEETVGKFRLHPQLEANDERAMAFRLLHEAIDAAAERFELEVLVVEAIASFAAIVDAKRGPSRAVVRAIELLRQKIGEAVTLDELAAHTGLDKFRLCRVFRTQMGIPPHAYLTHLRILRAKKLLTEGMKASEVAPLVGLYDQSQLNRHFRRIVGTTPGQYARAV